MFKMIYNIARTELQMLFYSPVAWLLLVVFTIQSTTLFTDVFEQIVTTQEMGYKVPGATYAIFAHPLMGLFTPLQNYLYFYIPLLTMGIVVAIFIAGD